MYRIIEKPAFRIIVILCLLLLLVKVVKAEQLPDTLLRESTDISNHPCKYKGGTYQCFLVTHKGKSYVVVVNTDLKQAWYVLEVKGRLVTEVWFHPDMLL